MRNTNDIIRDLWPLYIKCRNPHDKMLYWFFPLLAAWILWTVLGPRVPLTLFDKLRPRGKVPTFRQVLNCLPEAAGSTATSQGPPLSFANGRIPEALKRTTLFPREMVVTMDFRAELERMFSVMPGGLPWVTVMLSEGNGVPQPQGSFPPSQHIFFCDNELQAFFAETNNLQDIPRSLHDVATGLQKCFLSRPLK